MKRKLRAMFLVVEINLLLWLAVCGMAWANADDSGASWWHGAVQVDATLLLVGVGFAAIVQHWAYYGIRKEADKLTAQTMEPGRALKRGLYNLLYKRIGNARP